MGKIAQIHNILGKKLSILLNFFLSISVVYNMINVLKFYLNLRMEDCHFIILITKLKQKSHVVVCIIIIAGGGNKEVATYGNAPFFIPSIYSPILLFTLILPLLLIIALFIAFIYFPKLFNFDDSNQAFCLISSHISSHFLFSFSNYIRLFYFHLLLLLLVRRKNRQRKKSMEGRH